MDIVKPDPNTVYIERRSDGRYQAVRDGYVMYTHYSEDMVREWTRAYLAVRRLYKTSIPRTRDQQDV
jgi:hypothetical protein